ncbi:hypothetical protein Dsin_023527 [Dipteronia sinensis]|uniref:NB-ARC domain-containing protein n=1 Tax=Dipteronia sinensis TaxID=43782 RepID=A0AAE0E265_9ROSI|nr:hypothetical protein Dsin_023527 [Dipteronia sinensis]
MGGIGKTTLARAVFNDKAAVKDFNPRVRVCFSNHSDVLRILNAILVSVILSPCDLNDLNIVVNKLREAITGKKFLLVLDDVWIENCSFWETLKSLFMVGAHGSRIMVTTRLEEVASKINPSSCYKLKLLSNDDCWSLFERHAFEFRDIVVDRNIELLCQKVVQKCEGSPLTAKTLGGILRYKPRNRWLDILNSKIWDLPDKNEIHAVLKLSYYHLPSHLKRCFAYCAIFPKDYVFGEEELIFLWIAEGLIQQSQENIQLEDIGSEYFLGLLSRSIFQQSSSNGSKYVMHDLIHDMAEWIFGDMNFRLEDGLWDHTQSRSLKKVLHISYTSASYATKNKFQVLQEVERVKHLRTFLPLSTTHPGFDFHYVTGTVFSDLLPKFKKLRVLSLQGYYVTELLDSIGHLKHLRNLNLSGTNIRSLPESISFLFNLQILNLRYCSHLIKLPSKMGSLINLRYLDITGVKLNEMPSGIKELTYLRKLSNFIVGKGIGLDVQELKYLKFLRGELCISTLDNVRDCSPKDTILIDKESLKELLLEWKSKFEDSRKKAVKKEEKILDML